jgi:hypothetical protein
MKPRYYLLYIAVLAVAGCKKADEPPPPAAKSDPVLTGYESDAAAETCAARDHLTASMTDEQVLRAIGIDPALVKLKPAPPGYGGDGSIKTAYTNETMDIEMSRVPRTGYLLVYSMDQGKRWIVKGNAP